MNRFTKSITFFDIGEVIFKKNKKASRLRISIKNTLEINVSVPIYVTFNKAEEFVISKTPWIIKSINDIKNKVKLNPVDKVKAKQVLKKKLDNICDKYEFKYNKLTVRDQKTRWGSCSQKNNISLNSKIMHLPEELIEYILLHELVHTRIKNHSKQFWDTLDLYIPLSKKLDKKLKKYSL